MNRSQAKAINFILKTSKNGVNCFSLVDSFIYNPLWIVLYIIPSCQNHKCIYFYFLNKEVAECNFFIPDSVHFFIQKVKICTFTVLACEGNI